MHLSSTTLDRARRGPSRASLVLLLGLASVGSLVVISSAHAEPGLVGQYRGRGDGRLTLTVAPSVQDPRGEGYRVTMDTAIPDACTGSVGGTARRVGPGRLRLATPNGTPAETCRLDLTFSADGRRVRAEATDCSYFHGTSCGFDGTLTRR